MASPPISIAANNGSIGGGEVMLLNIAEALRELGERVTVVAPRGDGSMSELADEARARGFDLTALPAKSRAEWMRRLRSWDARDREGILWCNGLLPAVATAGRRDRIVHLHQQPQNKLQNCMLRAARLRALRLIVPSTFMSSEVSGAEVLMNWCEDVVIEPKPSAASGAPVRVGFLGRLSLAKGVDTLVDALLLLDAKHPGQFRFVLAGTGKFVDTGSTEEVEAALQRVSHLTDRLGWVSREDLFGQIDVLAVPSRAAEPFGLVAIEAMAAGVPVFVSSAGALPEVIGDARYVVQAEDPAALANALAVFAADRSEAAVNQASLRARWEEQFSPAAGAARVAKMLAGLRA